MPGTLRSLFGITLLALWIAGCGSSSAPTPEATPTPAEIAAQTDAAVATPEATPEAQATEIAEVEATAAPTPTPEATAAPTATPASGKKTYAALSDIMLKTGGNVEIGKSEPMPADAMNSQEAQQLGVKPVGGMMQEATIGGTNGSVVFVEFASEDEATAAQAKIQEMMSQRMSRAGASGAGMGPMPSFLNYGKFLVMSHATDGSMQEQYSKSVQELLD